MLTAQRALGSRRQLEFGGKTMETVLPYGLGDSLPTRRLGGRISWKEGSAQR